MDSLTSWLHFILMHSYISLSYHWLLLALYSVSSMMASISTGTPIGRPFTPTAVREWRPT